VVRNNRENRKQRRRKVIPQQEDGEGENEVDVCSTAGLAAKRRYSAHWRGTSEDCVKEPS
jgi:hypothetical protein